MANKMCIYLRSIENKADYSKWDKLPCFLELVETVSSFV